MIRIAITSVGSLVGQNILDSLEGRREGIEVVGVNSVAAAAGNFRCDRAYLAPPASRSGEYLDRLAAVLNEEKPDLVLPGRDDDVLALARLKGKRRGRGRRRCRSVRRRSPTSSPTRRRACSSRAATTCPTSTACRPANPTPSRGCCDATAIRWWPSRDRATDRGASASSSTTCSAPRWAPCRTSFCSPTSSRRRNWRAGATSATAGPARWRRPLQCLRAERPFHRRHDRAAASRLRRSGPAGGGLHRPQAAAAQVRRPTGRRDQVPDRVRDEPCGHRAAPVRRPLAARGSRRGGSLSTRAARRISHPAWPAKAPARRRSRPNLRCWCRVPCRGTPHRVPAD